MHLILFYKCVLDLYRLFWCARRTLRGIGCWWGFWMPDYRRTGVTGGSYFFTVVTFRRQRFLCDDNVRDALRQGVQQTRARFPFDVDAWVLLPDGDADFGKRWSLIKRYVSKQCGYLKRDEWMNASKRKRNESTLWQRRFWEHHIRDERDYEKHIDYIHHNPVKHGYVNKVSDWPYSTYHRYVEKGIYPIEWGGVNDMGDGAYGDLECGLMMERCAGRTLRWCFHEC